MEAARIYSRAMMEIGKLLIMAGLFLVALGCIFLLAGKFPFLGKLPGDFHFMKGNVEFYFPLATSLLVSVVGTILLNLFFRK